ncbi:hypothetical protein ACFWZ7_14410 [Nocardiopsis alba]|uniref:hypothetical protein n=1 Tax=Nocardiopsis alba TaxID=53437 RepID=UPI00366EF4EB
MKSTPRHPATKPLIIVAGIACVLLVLAVMAGAGNAIVYTLTALALAGIGGVVYLTQTTKN